MIVTNKNTIINKNANKRSGVSIKRKFNNNRLSFNNNTNNNIKKNLIFANSLFNN